MSIEWLRAKSDRHNARSIRQKPEVRTVSNDAVGRKIRSMHIGFSGSLIATYCADSAVVRRSFVPSCQQKIVVFSLGHVKTVHWKIGTVIRGVERASVFDFGPHVMNPVMNVAEKLTQIATRGGIRSKFKISTLPDLIDHQFSAHGD
ncbi:MAG: hypothetical protein ABR964_06805 [Tepidisphaeraceae bacterium]